MKIKLGEKYDGPEVAGTSKGESKIYYPSLRIEKKSDGPGAKLGKFKAVIEGEIVEVSKRETENGTVHVCQADVHTIEFQKVDGASKTDRQGNEAMREHFQEKEESEDDEY